jgi:NAD(P)-dependent dehydrogenase (short-subunit alcohol dehydrogenase family)
MSDMAGKVVLVTGGSSGIGRAAAIRFGARGASVVLAARGEQRGREALAEVRATRAAAEFVAADVSQPGDVERLVRTTVDAFGHLDFAFNNAASIEPREFKPTADLTEDEFDRAYQLNLRSVWLCMKHELAQMVRQRSGGAIVNTSSINGLGGCAFAAPYAIAKAGVLALTKSAAQEYAAHGIRVNAIVAGAFDTPMLRSAMERQTGGDPAKVREAEKAYEGFVPLRRIGKPEEAAAAAVWLCSADASYVTGNSLIVDGGMTAWAR